MPFSVALLTEPKPTAITVIPAAFRVLAVWIAPDEPPYCAFCSPSVSTITTRAYVELEIPPSTEFMAVVRPALMCVPPVVGQLDVPYEAMPLWTLLRTNVRPWITSAFELKKTIPACEWPVAMLSCDCTVCANVLTPASSPPIEPLRSSTNANAMR